MEAIFIAFKLAIVIAGTYITITNYCNTISIELIFILWIEFNLIKEFFITFIYLLYGEQ